MVETFVAKGSSNIAQFTYDPEVENLTVEFQDGREYVYFNVPLRVYQNWCADGGSGKYFWRQIRSVYAYEEQ